VSASSTWNSTYPLPYEPNALITGYSGQPTSLSLTFILNDIRYRYGVAFTDQKIEEEWLYRKKTGREVDLFVRSGEVIDTSSALSGGKKVIDAAIEATKDNTLFLSMADVFNIEECSEVFAYLDGVAIINGLDVDFHQKVSRQTLAQHPELIDFLNPFISELDLGILHLTVENNTTDGTPVVKAAHEVLNEDGTPTGTMIKWDLDKHESSGTLKVINTIPPILLVLRSGGVVIIDEIEARLHTKLTAALVKLFLDPKTNPKQAQLLLATHDTNLLNSVPLRRDQINFVEKDKAGATTIYSLSDFNYYKGNAGQPDKDKEKRYLEGRYGATPAIDLSAMIPA
jgi:predicted ATPase